MHKRDYIELLGENIYYEALEVAKKKKPISILFVHGFNSSSAIIKKMIEHVETLYEQKQRHNFNIFALDLPGCGKSSNNNEISLEFYGKIVSEFIKKFLSNHKVILLSHSMGSVPCLYAKKENKNVIDLIMTAPLNYALVDDENRYAQLKKWLVPSNVEDAKEAFLSLFYKPSNQHIMYVDRLAPMVVNNYQRDIKKFDNLLNNQILNREYLLNVVKPLFMNDDEYAIIYSRDDKYLMVEQIKMIERDKDVKTYLLTECGHATFSDKWKEVYNIVIQRINELENEAK